MKFDAQAYTVNRVVVLGAGTMGAQIAAQVAARGIPCDLLDMRSEGDRPNGIAEEAKVRLSKARPSVLESPADLDLIHPGNFDDDMARVAEADWVIEAIVERPEPKAQLWSRVGQHIGENTIASSNTSGIPIAQIAEALPEQVRSRFLGTHFFNPPRYVRLLELISAPTTDPAVLEAIRAFASERLDKGVVRANDVPGFISNRIGTYYFLSVLHAAEASTGAVSGRVTSSIDGRPLPGAEVRLQTHDGDKERWFGRRGGSSITDSDGAFQFATVAAGQYTVQAEAQGLAGSRSAVFDVTSGSTRRGVEIRLSRSVTVRGRVLFDGLEETPTWAYLSATTETGERSGTRVDLETGTFVFDDLAPERNWSVGCYLNTDEELNRVELFVRSDRSDVELVFRPLPPPEPEQLDETQLKQLEALGYTDGDGD